MSYDEYQEIIAIRKSLESLVEYFKEKEPPAQKNPLTFHVCCGKVIRPYSKVLCSCCLNREDSENFDFNVPSVAINRLLELEERVNLILESLGKENH